MTSFTWDEDAFSRLLKWKGSKVKKIQQGTLPALEEYMKGRAESLSRVQNFQLICFEIV